MSFSFAMAHKTDPLLTDIRNKYGMEYLKDFGLDGELNTTLIKTKENPESFSYFKISSLLDNSPIPPFIGSNSWVIAPKKLKMVK
jgi:penicillin amidase